MNGQDFSWFQTIITAVQNNPLGLAALAVLVLGLIMSPRLKNAWAQSVMALSMLLFVGWVLTDQERAIQSAESQIGQVVDELSLTADAWEKLSKQLLREPSGLTASHLVDPATSRPYAIAVDDESRSVFMVQSISDGRTVVGNVMSFDVPVEDLEGIAYAPDRGERYFALTSHRSYESSVESKLLTFDIVRDSSEFAIRLVDERSLSPQLEEVLHEAGVEVDAAHWREGRRRTELHPYALELEGLTYFQGRLLIGLRWPLHEGDAILLSYDPTTSVMAVAGLLPLDGLGISALAFDAATQTLLVAANPTENPRSEAEEEHYYGKSRVFTFKYVTDSGFKRQNVYGDNRVVNANAKLEGIAFVGDEVWLAFDGADPAFAQLSRASLGL